MRQRLAHRPINIIGTSIRVLMIAWILALSPVHSTLANEANDRAQAISIALQKNGGQGKVLSVNETVNARGQTLFAVKVLSNGRVRVYQIRKRQ